MNSSINFRRTTLALFYAKSYRCISCHANSHKNAQNPARTRLHRAGTPTGRTAVATAGEACVATRQRAQRRCRCMIPHMRVLRAANPNLLDACARLTQVLTSNRGTPEGPSKPRSLCARTPSRFRFNHLHAFQSAHPQSEQFTCT